jgi:predicted site-specific integrase-resolvase
MSNTYSLKQFAELIGKHEKTLQKWDREGTLKAHRSPTNRRYYTHDQYLEYMGLVADKKGQTVAYARVSTAAQKPDLANQMAALEAYCNDYEIKVDEWMQDIGSGLNYKRKQFNRLFEMVELGQVKVIIIAHRDRLVRFGYEWFEAYCSRHGTRILVINGDKLSPEKEMVEDLLAIVTVFSARFHGLQSYRKAIKDACLPEDQN